jgi:DNA-binding winged helix-turn-helix (wHTH) protein
MTCSFPALYTRVTRFVLNSGVMRAGARTASVYRFGQFELDRRSGELRKAGTRLRLQQQPLNLLLLLIDHAGEVVTREQIRTALWAPDVHVDYDSAINSSMRKLREALCDDSDRPRFIETQSGRGYRFIGRIDGDDATQVAHPAPVKRTRAVRAALALGMALLASVAAILWWRSRQEPSLALLTPLPLTGNRGSEGEPSFSPDGTQIAYSWDEGARPDPRNLSHIYVKLIGEGQPVRITSGPDTDMSPAWSPDGRFIAFVRKTNPGDRIYIVPALGGTERPLAQLDFAGFDPDFSPPTISWSPDSRLLAVSESTSR